MYLGEMRRFNNEVSILVPVERNNLIHCVPEKLIFVYFMRMSFPFLINAQATRKRLMEINSGNREGEKPTLYISKLFAFSSR